MLHTLALALGLSSALTFKNKCNYNYFSSAKWLWEQAVAPKLIFRHSEPRPWDSPICPNPSPDYQYQRRLLYDAVEKGHKTGTSNSHKVVSRSNIINNISRPSVNSSEVTIKISLLSFACNPKLNLIPPYLSRKPQMVQQIHLVISDSASLQLF